MKKNLFILASGAIVATAICISLFSHSYNPTKSTSLLSANIEALSRDEGDEEMGPYNRGTTTDIEFECTVFEWTGAYHKPSKIKLKGKGCTPSQSICMLINPCY